MDLSIILLLLKAFFEMAMARVGIFISVLFILFLLTIPLGYLIIRYFRLFEEKDTFWYDQLSLSLGIGTGIVILLSFFTMFIKFSAVLICSEILLINLALLYLCFKNKLFRRKENRKANNKNIKLDKYSKIVSVLTLLFLLIMFGYYSLMPLTTDMAIFRDYDLLALGIQQNSALKLPFYDMDNYYTPGGSILVALLNLVYPEVNIHKFMLNLSYFFVFYLFILFYQLGNIGFKNKFLGFFFMVAFAISAPSRNFVTGGSTYPATTSIIFCMVFLIFILKWLKNESNKNFYFASIFLAAGALTHIDALFVFLWGFLALLITYLIFDLKNYKKYLFLFIKVGILSMLIISPFLMNSLQGKQKLEERWSGENWEEHIHGELHPKSLGSILFFTGKWVFYLFLLGLVYLIYLSHRSIQLSSHGIYLSLKGIRLSSRDKMHKPCLFILLWAIILLLTNNFLFLRFARPFIIFYPLAGIMWFGIAIVFSLGAGFGFYFLFKLISEKLDSKLIITLFLIIIVSVAFIKILDYETYNKEKVFNRQGGFIKSVFASRNNFYNQGDVYLMEWLKDNEIQNIIIPWSWFAFSFPSITKIKPFTIYISSFYADPDAIDEMFSRERLIKKIYDDNMNYTFYEHKVNDTLIFNNFSYMFLQSSRGGYGLSNILLQSSPQHYGIFAYSKSMLESGRYDIIQRRDGAKILKPNIENFNYLRENITLTIDEFETKLLVEKADEIKTYITKTKAEIKLIQDDLDYAISYKLKPIEDELKRRTITGDEYLGKEFIHTEVEDSAKNLKVNIYTSGIMVDITTVELDNQSSIQIDVSNINKSKNMYDLYIKHLTFVTPLILELKVGNKIYKFYQLTNKLTFSESKFNISNKDLMDSNFVIEITGISEPLNFLGQTYYPEVDWIELEAVE